MSKTRRYQGLVAVGGIFVSVALAGIISATPAGATAGPDNLGFIPASEVNAAWVHLASAKGYGLPAGVALPATPPSVLTTPGSFVQVGALETVAAYYYVCAWEDNLAGALESKNDVGISLAQQRLGVIALLPEVKAHVKDLNAWQGALSERLTDSKALRADVSNCTYYLEGK